MKFSIHIQEGKKGKIIKKYRETKFSSSSTLFQISIIFDHFEIKVNNLQET